MKWFDFLFRRTTGTVRPLYMYNTLGNSLQEFIPPSTGVVKMYNCGPTVYDVQHIGNLAMFVFADTLRRVLEYNGLHVKQVINITDFGHLTSDADLGEDKMSKGLRREGLALTLENMHTLGEKYTTKFLDDLKKLNIPIDAITFPRASSYVPAQIAMIKTLEEKGYAYRGKEGVYFNTAHFPTYGQLGNINLVKQQEGTRSIVSEKKNPSDFVLWKSDKALGWDSPWGLGFPGWHIECSAMIRAILGERIDIHTGGPEHVAVHHNNEIAQSEAVTGKSPFVRFWLHRAWIQLGGAKLAKSEGNVVYLSTIVERGFDPLVYRYWLLGAKYRTPANFSWEALLAAKNAFQNLLQRKRELGEVDGEAPASYLTRFHERINDDLDTPGALGVMWDMLKDTTLKSEHVAAGLQKMDAVFGLALYEENRKVAGIHLDEEMPVSALPLEIQKDVAEREEARKNKDWKRADEAGARIKKAGYIIKDGPTGPRLFKK